MPTRIEIVGCSSYVETRLPLYSLTARSMRAKRARLYLIAYDNLDQLRAYRRSSSLESTDAALQIFALFQHQADTKIYHKNEKAFSA